MIHVMSHAQYTWSNFFLQLYNLKSCRFRIIAAPENGYTKGIP